MRRTALVCLACMVCVGCGGLPPAPDFDIDQPIMYSRDPVGMVVYNGRMQVIAYNVERGFHWPDAVRYIEEQVALNPATVVLVTETDRDHHRTGDVFVAELMARELNMNMAWVAEFVEYNDNTTTNQGTHGNAVLSPFPIADVTVLRHLNAFDWRKWGGLMGEPRYGDRVTMGATIELPDGAKVRVYSVHLESHSHSAEKWRQIEEVFEDVDNWPYPAVVGGDFNELPGGLMFMKMKKYDMINAFAGNRAPTGDCRAKDDRARCLLKIDWIVYKDLELIESAVDYPLTQDLEIISDHAPVRAIFEVP